MKNRRLGLLLVALLSATTLVYCSGQHVAPLIIDSDGGAKVADASVAPDSGSEAPDASDTFDAGISPEDAGTEPEDAGTEPVDAGTEPVDAGPQPKTSVRFVAIGDFGKGNDKQYAVGAAMASVCTARGGCDFAITLGDNFYPSGASSVTDQIWQTAFELPYQDLNVRFYATLGNHDYGNSGSGTDLKRAEVQIAYTAKSQKWYMPAHHYTFTEGPIDFVALDMNAIFLEDTPGAGTLFPEIKAIALEQKAIMNDRTAALTKPWKIALGHHPYLSNGEHGNAGWYDSVYTLGSGVKSFVDTYIKGKYDVYLAGHDHSMQDLGNKDGTEFIVSGAGASTTNVRDPGSLGANPVKFQSDASGFLLVEATATEMTFKFFDATGTEVHSRTITK
jgi:hypothetical protein